MSKTQAMNPFLPGYEYVPDAEPYVFGDRLYMYGSHDRFGGKDFCMNDYVCWSAPVDDLGAWRKEGVIYRADQDPFNTDGSQHLFAPDVIRGKDGRYYLFYCLHKTQAVSVAVCDTPAGEYQFYGHVKHPDGSIYGKNPKDVFNFDPGLFRDDDGKIYLYTGISYGKDAPIRQMLQQMFSLDGSYCVELDEDMLTMKTEPVLAVPGDAVAEGTGFEGHGFFEASSPRKINGKYYLVYSSILSHELCYAISDSPVTGFTYGGIIISNGDIGLVEEAEARNYTSNNHGGLVEVNGQWYITYHRHTNGYRNSRQMCAEPVEIAPDGSIAQVEVTSCGFNGGPLQGHGKYDARIACNLSSAEGTFMYQNDPMEKDGLHPFFTQDVPDGETESGQYIANMRDGAWAGFKYFEMDGSEKSITVCTRGSGEGVLEIRTQQDQEPVAKISLSPSADWSESTGALEIKEGTVPLYITYRGSGSVDFLWFSL